MSLREIRRMSQKKAEKAPKQMKKEHEKHPVIYAGSVILLVLIVVAFVGTPVSGSFSPSKGIKFGSYKGRSFEYLPQETELSNSFFTQMFKAALRNNQNRVQEGEQLYRSSFEQALNTTIYYSAIMDAAEQSGVVITSKQLTKRLLTQPEYMDPDTKLFSERIRQKQTNSFRFFMEKINTEQMVYQQLLDDVLLKRLQNQKLLEYIANMGNSQRSFQFAVFSFDEYPENLYQEYAQKNSKIFQKIQLARLTIKNDAGQANKIHEEVVGKPESFEDAVKNYSQDDYKNTGGRMLEEYYYDFKKFFNSDEEITEVFKMKQNEISKVYTMLTDKDSNTTNFCIYKVLVPARIPEKTELLNTAKTYFNNMERGEIQKYIMDKANAFREKALSTGFDKAAAALGRKIEKTALFAINPLGLSFLNPPGQVTGNNHFTSLMQIEDFYQKAFALKPNEVSAPEITTSNSIIIYSLDQTADKPAADPITVQDFVKNKFGFLQDYNKLNEFMLFCRPWSYAGLNSREDENPYRLFETAQKLSAVEFNQYESMAKAIKESKYLKQNLDNAMKKIFKPVKEQDKQQQPQATATTGK